MPNQPTLSAVHVDRALTDLSVRFTLESDMFIADKVFPVVPVKHVSDKYRTYDRAFWFKSNSTKRAPGTESAGSGFEIGQDSYLCDVHAVHYDLSDQVKANADSVINLDKDAVDFVTGDLQQQKEADFISTFMATSIWAKDYTGVAAGEAAGTTFRQWNDYANSDPITDLRRAVLYMAQRTGRKPNTLILGPEVWNQLQDHPDFLDRVKYGQTPGSAAMVSTQTLAAMIEIDRVFVPTGIQNTGGEGETAAYSFLHGKSGLLVHTPASAGLNTPAAGYTFSWSGFLGSGGTGIRVKRFRMEHLESDRIEAEMAYDQKLVSADLGVFLADVIA